MVAIPLAIQDSSSLKYPTVPYGAAVGASPERIGVAGQMPPWWPTVERRLVELSRLPWDWDPRGGRAVSRQDMRDALLFMLSVMRPDTVVPRIMPLSTGGIQVTWQRGVVEVEAIFDHARGDRELLVSVGEHEWDAPADRGASLFATVVDRLAHDALD